MTPKAPQSTPKGTPRRHIATQRSPKGATREHKRVPRRAQRVPRSAKESPTALPECPQWPQGAPKSGPRAPQGSQTCPKSLPQSAQEHSQRVPSRSQRLLWCFSVPALPHQVGQDEAKLKLRWAKMGPRLFQEGCFGSPEGLQRAFFVRGSCYCLTVGSTVNTVIQ